MSLADKLIEQGKITIQHWTDQRPDEDEEEDPWRQHTPGEMDSGLQMVAMEEVFEACGMRVMRGKEPGFMAFVDGKIVGATFYSAGYHHHEMTEDNPDLDGKMAYEFDLAVLPAHQGGTVGYLLVQASIREARSMECELMWNWVINPKMAAMLERLFKFQHAHEPEEYDGTLRGRFSAHMFLLL